MYKTKFAKLISDDLNNLERIERKQFDIICEACSKLIQQCNKKDLKVADLKWQPHYSTVFKQLKSQLESILNKDSSKSLEKLNCIPYLLSLKNNIFTLLNNMSKFVTENGSLIGVKDHHLRRTFFVKVVHFQFLCHEIQSYFPGGIYSPAKVKISKTPARIWWDTNFGEEIFVNLDTFVTKFNENYPFINQAEIFSFKSSINFTTTNFITTFEFDLFTRLYSPWEMIQEAWRIIYTHPAYLHFSTYGDTKDILSRHLDRPGTYVFRVSCKDLGFWTIGYVKGSKDMGQIKVDKTNLIEALVEGQKKNIYMYPNGEYTNPDLSNLNQYRKEIVVKNEDLQLYDCFEDFKECKICREGEKDLQLESCGHQICHSCFKMLRKYNKKLCPFCNQLILSTTKVVNVKNSSIYVDHNPAKIDSKSSRDSLYVDMSADGNQNINRSEEEGSIQMRSSALLRVKEDSLYSNMSDENIDLPVRILPGPPRPPREKGNRLNYDVLKSEINYPPMQKNKGSEVSSNNSINEVERSSIYAEMTSNITSGITSKKTEEMYCDFNDSEDDSMYNNEEHHGHTPSNNKVVIRPDLTNSASYTDELYSSPLEMNLNDITIPASIKTVLDDVYCNHNSSAEDDDIYALPKDDNFKINNIRNNDFGTVSNTEADIYSSPFNEASDLQPPPKVSQRINVFSTRGNDGEFTPFDDIYSNLMDESIKERMLPLLPKEDEGVQSNPRILLINDDVYSNLLDGSNDEEKEYLEPNNLCTNKEINTAGNVIKEDEEGKVSKAFDSRNDDDIYCNASDDTDTIVNVYPGLTDLFSNWEKSDIDRALRVARNDKVLALDILLEFVPVK